MQDILKSNKLANVFYDIRGPVAHAAKKMEEDGHRILKLNIGNLKPARFRRLLRFQRSIFCPQSRHAILPAKRH